MFVNKNLRELEKRFTNAEFREPVTLREKDALLISLNDGYCGVIFGRHSFNTKIAQEILIPAEVIVPTMHRQNSSRKETASPEPWEKSR